MNSRFKSRAWYKKSKTMHEVLIIDFNKEQILLSKLENFIPLNEVKLMQCIGCTDKNNVTAFEEDILYFDSRCIEIPNDDFSRYGIIKHGEVSCMGAEEPALCYYLDKIIYKEMFVEEFIEESKIIGNSYENPELINEIISRAKIAEKNNFEY